VANFFFDLSKECLHPDAVDDVFQSRFEPVGAVAEIDEYPHDGIGDFGGVRRPDDDAGFANKIPVAGDAAKAQAKPDARFNPEAVLHVDGRESNVVGIFENGNLSRAVERDVELAW